MPIVRREVLTMISLVHGSNDLSFAWFSSSRSLWRIRFCFISSICLFLPPSLKSVSWWTNVWWRLQWRRHSFADSVDKTILCHRRRLQQYNRSGCHCALYHVAILLTYDQNAPWWFRSNRCIAVGTCGNQKCSSSYKNCFDVMHQYGEGALNFVESLATFDD